jgi:hypothetical protein
MYVYRYDWVSYTPDVLVCWEVMIRGDGTISRSMLRLLILGEVTSDNVRAIPLRQIHTADPDTLPTWSLEFPVEHGYPDMDTELPAPPTGEQVDEAWRSHAKRKPRKVQVEPRRADETPDQWYARVADIYRTLGDQGTPTSDLAALMGVSKDRAAQWVHQARKRGYLEATTRGKAKR